jgi:hypothetical protein
MSVKRILEIAHRIGLGSPETQLKQLKQIDGGSVYARRVAQLTVSDRNFKSVRNAVFAYALPRLFVEIDSALTQVFRPVRYIAPVRATAERFYRQQDLSVNEVDPQGANLAMFLQSLNWTEKEQFSEWCREKLGFSVRAQLEGSHISLVLRDEGSSTEHNIADMGFGFSQILPVLAQIWSLTRKAPVRPLIGPSQPGFSDDDETEYSGDIITVEQPELHLHPRLQAKVADMFAAAATVSKAAKHPLTIIFETHSETIVNRIGHLVAHKKLAPEEVQVLLFEKESAESDTKVRLAQFGTDGILQNWPHGFFLAASDDSEFPLHAEIPSTS